MNFGNFLWLFGATQFAVHGQCINQIELENSQNHSKRVIHPYLVLLNFFGLDPETTMDTVELVQHRLYPIEIHTVNTSDNYILTMHRIRHGKNCTSDKTLDPILLIHGLFGSADYFLINTQENALAYLLADAGFDVWLANLRGSEHSRLHTNLSSTDPKFWEFSWDEMAKFDLPAFVDRMLDVTGRTKVILSGHSLGGSLPIAFLSSRPEYMSKIKGIFGLAPLGNLKNIVLLGRLQAPFMPFIKEFTDFLGFYEFPKISPILMGYYGKIFEYSIRCLIFYLAGPDPDQWDSERTEMNQGHLFSSTGLNILYHIYQLMHKNGFRKFDWGKKTNLKKYGQETPPDYDLSNITVPVHLYYGENDHLCTKENVQFLHDRLQNSVMHIAGNGWNHVDFIWGKYAGRSFYDYLVTFIKTI